MFRGGSEYKANVRIRRASEELPHKHALATTKPAMISALSGAHAADKFNLDSLNRNVRKRTARSQGHYAIGMSNLLLQVCVCYGLFQATTVVVRRSGCFGQDGVIVGIGPYFLKNRRRIIIRRIEKK